MLERVVENWLDNASEKSYQKPFCYILAADGYSVVHISRHCGMELGKDIIAKAPDGVYCAFQLKSAEKGNISLKEWRKINAQLFDLVTTSISHPSVNTTKHHRSYLVTNGNLTEEVQEAINKLNENWKKQKQAHLKLNTIVREKSSKKQKN